MLPLIALRAVLAVLAVASISACGSPAAPAPGQHQAASAPPADHASEAPATAARGPDGALEASAPASSPSSSPAASGPPAAAQPAAVVVARGIAFEPAEVELPAGAVVAWRNSLPVRHTVTAGTRDAPEPERFDLELIDADQVVTLAPTASTPYFCRIHAGMTGTLTVAG